MNTFFSLALGLLIVALGVALALGLTITYHFKRFGVQGDQSQKLMLVFLVGMALLVLLVLVAFFRVPWNDIPTLLGR